MTTWQKKQATLLYYFTSLNYLKELREEVTVFKDSAEATLQKSQKEGRDRFLLSAGWGNRDTAANWSNNGWGYIADFELSILRQIADRAAEIYHVTDASFCGRGMSEYSLMWTTPDEQAEFEKRFAEILEHANYLDVTVDKSTEMSAWDDFEFTVTWERYSSLFPRLPKFTVNTDICIETGEKPPRTGVYIPADDPNASLQFAWRGDAYGALLDCTTFNELGIDALSQVGRDRLWRDEKAMRDFVSKRLSDPVFLNDPFFNGLPSEELAPSLVARCAFRHYPCKWYYVEMVEGEYEPIENEINNMQPFQQSFRAGTSCNKSGFYFTPARSVSRQFFSEGQLFPELGSSYGETIWQWDQRQD